MRMVLSVLLLTALFSCPVFAGTGEVIQETVTRYSSDRSEAASKTVGFSEEDFEILDGKVVIKKSIVEAIAKKLLKTDDIEVNHLIPWFEAEIQDNSQIGQTAVIYPSPVLLNRAMLKVPPEVPMWSFAVDEVLLLNITSSNDGEFLKFVRSGRDYEDGRFYLDSGAYISAPPIVEYQYTLGVYISDGGKFDLDKTQNGFVVGQMAIVGRVKNEEGCNAGYGSFSILLTVLLIVINNRKKPS